MTRNPSIADFPEAYQRQIAEKLRERASPSSQKIIEQVSRDAADTMRRLAREEGKPVSKYRNKRTPYKSTQGFERVYDSKREAEIARQLDALVGLHVAWWIPQPRIPLPGGVVYVADFLALHDGRVRFIDVKGRDTQASVNKRKQVKACYGIEVEIVK